MGEYKIGFVRHTGYYVMIVMLEVLGQAKR